MVDLLAYPEDVQKQFVNSPKHVLDKIAKAKEQEFESLLHRLQGQSISKFSHDRIGKSAVRTRYSMDWFVRELNARDPSEKWGYIGVDKSVEGDVDYGKICDRNDYYLTRNAVAEPYVIEVKLATTWNYATLKLCDIRKYLAKKGDLVLLIFINTGVRNTDPITRMPCDATEFMWVPKDVLSLWEKIGENDRSAYEGVLGKRIFRGFSEKPDGFAMLGLESHKMSDAFPWI